MTSPLRLAIAACALVLLASDAAAQSGSVVISSNTTWPEGTYSLDSLTVQNSATLTVGGGSTLNVAGQVLVTGAARVLLQGKNTTGQVGGQWVGAGSTIQAGSVQVDAGSQISADAQGYTASQGPGGGVTYYAGGTHGGSGSGNPAPTYGSYLAPVDLGSGGMTWGGAPSTGGGAIRLIVSGVLTNDGTITANGGAVSGTGAGAAGGSIHVTTGAIGGAGAFTAAGSTPGGGSTAFGGGGRIAIYYGTNDGFDLAKVTAAAGGGVATAGSVYLLENNANLLVPTALILPPDTSASFGTVTVLNGATLTLGGGSTLTVTGLLRVTGSATLLVQSKNTTGQVGGQWRGVGSTIQAGSVQVDAGSQISADGQGYTASQGPGGGVTYYTGGTHGGSGSGNPAPTYGSYLAPIDLGSGGMTYGGAPSTGGGAIRLIVSGALTNNGTITANGGAVVGTGAGAAGGSIYVTTGALGGTGAFTAGGSTPGGGATAFGGGGRIAIYYGTNDGFDLAKVTAAAGGGVATAGTVALVISPPALTSVSLGTAPAGTPVTLTGTGFTWATQVRFNATPQPIFTIVNDTTITTTVPAGATTGPIQVITAGGTATSATTFAVAPRCVITRAGDYDADGRADPTVFRPSEGAWYELRTATGQGHGTSWGVATDVLVPADYDGDGRADEAVYRPESGTWFVMRSSTHQGMSVVWGLPDDIPVPADYDGDGKTDVAVYRPSTGVWYIIRSQTNTAVAIPWGLAGDVPVPGDYDGDRHADPTVFRPATGAWYQLRRLTGGVAVVWGQAGDVPLAADYDGDGKADPTVFRPSTGTWYELRSTTGVGFGVIWGMAGDQPIAGDYDGDGKADPTVFRPSTGTWFQLRSTTGQGYGVSWGAAGDLPL